MHVHTCIAVNVGISFVKEHSAANHLPCVRVYTATHPLVTLPRTELCVIAAALNGWSQISQGTTR